MHTIGLSTIAIATFAFSGLATAANEAAAPKAAEAVTTTAQSQPSRIIGQPSQRDAGSRLDTRDWSRVDANGDHLVSPEEMENYLKANPGPLRGGS